MTMIPDIRAKYNVDDIRENLKSAEQVNDYALDFFKDVTNVYRLAIDQKNPIRNPSGYSLSDAPILGLLVRMWKLSSLVVRYFEQDNGENIATFHRPLMEASVTALYLLRQDNAVIQDYRRCSYKDALRILRDYKAGSPFFRTRAGRRLLTSVREKLALEGLTEDSFSPQKQQSMAAAGQEFLPHIRVDVSSRVLPLRLRPFLRVHPRLVEQFHGLVPDSKRGWDVFGLLAFQIRRYEVYFLCISLLNASLPLMVAYSQPNVPVNLAEMYHRFSLKVTAQSR